MQKRTSQRGCKNLVEFSVSLAFHSSMCHDDGNKRKKNTFIGVVVNFVQRAGFKSHFFLASKNIAPFPVQNTSQDLLTYV